MSGLNPDSRFLIPIVACAREPDRAGEVPRRRWPSRQLAAPGRRDRSAAARRQRDPGALTRQPTTPAPAAASSVQACECLAGRVAFALGRWRTDVRDPLRASPPSRSGSRRRR